MNMTSKKTRRSFFKMVVGAVTAAPVAILAAAKAVRVSPPPVTAFIMDGVLHVPMPGHLMSTLVRVRPGDPRYRGKA